MADRKISQLTQVGSIGDADLFVVEQSGAAMSVSGETLKEWLLILAEGNGGISKITGPVSSGTNPVVDTYTIHFESGRTKTFTVTNGVKGDTGAMGPASHIYIRYASQQPTADNQMSTEPDAWMGICVSDSSTAPSSYTSYTWYRIRGDGVATVTRSSGSGGPGTIDVYDVVLENGAVAGQFSVYNGLNGSGAVSSVDGISPDENGNVSLAPKDIGASTSASLAADFSDVLTYAVGDYVIYNGQLYVCTTAIATPGAWDSTKWTAANVASCKADASSHGLSTYNSVTQFGLTNGTATIAAVWAALPENSIFSALTTEFLGTDLPSTAGIGTVFMNKTTNNGGTDIGYIEVHYNTISYGDYRMYLSSGVPTGTWNRTANGYDVFKITTKTLSITIDASSYESYSDYTATQRTVTESGYYPLCIVGLDGESNGSTNTFPIRWYLEDQAVGSCKVCFLFRNGTAGQITPTVKFKILWMKA